MKTLHELKNKALAAIRHEHIQKELNELFEHFGMELAQKIIQRSNRVPRDLRGNELKGAMGEAVVVAAMAASFGQYDGRGFFEGQYEMWMGRDLDASYPMRKMDILFIMPLPGRRSVTFQVEVKNYGDIAGRSKVGSGAVQTQLDKDEGYLKPKIRHEQGIIPVWWFLQGIDQGARGALETRGIRVVDFTKPLRHEVSMAFST
jgi:hypothetical protein